MSDERSEFVAAMRACERPAELRVLHRAVIVDQDTSTVGVKLVSPDAPSETAKPVPVWFGLPGFAAKFRSGAETMTGFVAGREDGAFTALYPHYPQGTVEALQPSPVEYLSFLGGIQPIARKGDSVSCGAYRMTNTPPAPGPIPTGFVIEFSADPNDPAVPWTPVGAILGPIAVAPSPLVIPINGKITTGREEFRA